MPKYLLSAKATWEHGTEHPSGKRDQYESKSKLLRKEFVACDADAAKEAIPGHMSEFEQSLNLNPNGSLSWDRNLQVSRPELFLAIQV